MARRVQPSELVQPESQHAQFRRLPEEPWELGDFRLMVERRCAGAARGGDFLAWALRAPTRLAVVIGDACGRGADGAGLLPAVLHDVQVLLHSETTPGRLLTGLNGALAGELPVDRFVTAVAFELEARAGTLVVASAGHVPLLLRDAHGNVRTKGMPTGPPLGLLEEWPYAEEHDVIGRGDLLVVMTDGVLEALESDLFAMSTLREFLSCAPAEAQAVHRSFVERLDGCSVRRPDDMLLASLEVLAEPRAGAGKGSA